jgi:hypothetical protein
LANDVLVNFRKEFVETGSFLDQAAEQDGSPRSRWRAGGLSPRRSRALNLGRSGAVQLGNGLLGVDEAFGGETDMHKIFALAALSMTIAGAASAQAPSWNGRYDDPPRGSYTQSCREITAFNGQVWARCQTGRGNWEWTSARPRDCGGQGLENRDGRLECAGWNNGGGNGGWNGGGGWNNGGYGGSRPGNSYRGDVLMFEDSGYEGRVYEVVGDMPDLGMARFNDKASSIKIVRGKWEICEHANYQGRCSRLDADQPVLPREWNDAISSIRRAR